ncbi:MAG: hypothetical protein K2W33_15055 [Burkholderiales bacterium]|nr:hypothetical protein [Burkholderiales bacterium]
MTTTSINEASRVVIVHPEMGIYLGSCMGMGFWSKLDPVGQPSAVTFANPEEAQAHMQGWDCGPQEGASCHAVIADQIDGQGPYAAHFASIQACVQAGLEGWTDAFTPVANEMPC